MSESDTIDPLIEQGFEHLREGAPEKALEIGHKLYVLQHTSAFEIMALAYSMMDQLDQSIEALEDGVAKAPDVWRLWQLLGNCYSNAERFDESDSAYRRALDCPNVDTDSVHLNLAIVSWRRDELEAASEWLSNVTVDELELAGQATYVWLLNNLEQYAESIATCRRLIEAGESIDADDEDLAPLHAEHAVALWKSHPEDRAALTAAWQAIELDKGSERALWVVREIEGKCSEQSKYFRLLVEGVWMEPFEDGTGIPGFFTSYDVVADTQEEAFELLKRFEPAEVRDSLAISECEVVEDCPGERHGVYHTVGYSFFFPDEND